MIKLLCDKIYNTLIRNKLFCKTLSVKTLSVKAHNVKKPSVIVLCVVCITMLSGCSKEELKVEALKNKSAEQIYDIGKQYAKKNQHIDATLAFEEVEKQYPYSEVVAEAQIAAGESYYKVKKYEEASSALESFIQINTTHEKVPYALYLLGCIYFDQMPIIQRDQENTFRALEYFQELCIRYPKSEYVKQSQDKLKTIIAQLANQEFRTGRYYQKHKNFPAAILRFNTVIETYPNTETAQEALHRLVECYVATGFIQEAKAVYKVLLTKYKNSKWTKYSNNLLKQYK